MKKQFKSTASSGRAASGSGFGFGGFATSSAFDGSGSSLSYVYEPPDLGSFSDANLVVSFKNLMKKDATTKSKALEDIQTYLKAAAGDLEETVIAAYAKLYPRLSIDTNRRVRQLAHVVLGLIVQGAGKRMGPYMQQIAGPWYCGQADSDRGVARAATEALHQAFQSKEKVQSFSKQLQRPIAEYCRNAILNETPQTLSDERTVSKEDSNATYSRVVSAGLSSLSSLVADLPSDEIQKHVESYHEILKDKRVWELSISDDAGSRRAIFRFLSRCLGSNALIESSNPSVIGNILINKGLLSDQTGTAADLAAALAKLTQHSPSIWTAEYKGKKPPIQRLRHFLKRGSQHSATSFWPSMVALFTKLPSEVLSLNGTDLNDFMKDLLTGVTHKDDRLHATEAWAAYLDLADISVEKETDGKTYALSQGFVMPIISQFLDPTPANSQWSLPTTSTQMLLAKALQCRDIPDILTSQWSTYTSKLVESMRISQPEQSKLFEQSQEHIKLLGDRWVEVQSAFGLSSVSTVRSDVFIQERNRAVKEAISILQTRKGKPFGAANLLEQLAKSRHRMPDFSSTQDAVINFLQTDGADLIFSPSQSYLVGLLYDNANHPAFNKVWTSFADAMTAQVSLPNLEALNSFLNFKDENKASDLAKTHAGIQNFIREIMRSGDSAHTQASVSRDLLDCMSEDTRDEILADAIASLSVMSPEVTALETLEIMDSYDSNVLAQFVIKGDGRSLLAKVIALEASPVPDVASKASNLHQRLAGGGADISMQGVSLELLSNELTTIPSEASSIDVILRMTQAALRTHGEKLWAMLSDLRPSWKDVLERTNRGHLDPSLNVMNPLAGMFGLEQSGSFSVGFNPKDAYDTFGLSQPVRLAMVAVEVLSASSDPAQMDAVAEAQILSLLLRTALSVDDELSIASPENRLVLRPTPAISEFVSQAKLSVGARLSSQSFDSSLFKEFSALCLSCSSGRTRESYSHAEAFKEFARNWTETHGFSKPVLTFLEEQFSLQRQQGNSLGLAAVVDALAPRLGTSQVLQKYCNELVSSLTSSNAFDDADKSATELAFLNIILIEAESIDGVVAKQRLVFFMKNVLNSLTNESTSSSIKYKIYMALESILSLISDIYGDHFDEILQAIKGVWKVGASGDWTADSSLLLLVNASLRIFQTLTSLSKVDEPNEDLIDAIKMNHDDMNDALIQLLISPQEVDELTHTPLAITNRLLARTCLRVDTISTATATDLYPLVDAKSVSIQDTALTLLQRFTEQNQEQISFDAAIDKKTAHIPEELLSFVISAPSIDSVLSSSLDIAIPEDLQTYLFTWTLIFSHFKKASSKVREDYTEDIRSQDLLPPLLGLIYEFLGHATGHAVDVSRYDVVNYVRSQESDPERHLEWLLGHLYYLSLTYLPALTKSHYLAIGNRTTSGSISKWVARYFSPLIISASLASVSTWAESFTSDPEYENFSIKVRPRAQEITASYLVDEQTMAIMVRLPDAYPLEGARVEGISRVAVDQRKWLAWLRNCQGVIQFSNGDVVDGLASWRRNVLGALKGQTECAICYSVISADRQLPSKRCGTCKNGFHSGCLFKWFKTSNASSCPLCRTAFNYG